MLVVATISAARAASLATGRAGMPTAEEWPWVAAILIGLACLGTWFFATVGLTYVESALLAAAAPALVLVDVPLGQLAPGLALAANTAGCLIPLAIALKILAERRSPWLEIVALIGLGIGISFLASRVVPNKGVLLQYRIPALVIGFAAAALFYNKPAVAGSAAFIAGTFGVIVGADIMHMPELAAVGGEGRIILGGAGILDGIFLVAIFAAMMAASVATLAHNFVKARQPPVVTRS